MGTVTPDSVTCPVSWEAPPETLVVEQLENGIEVVGLLEEPSEGLNRLQHTLEIVALGARRRTGEVLVLVARERLVELPALLRFEHQVVVLVLVGCGGEPVVA